MPLQEVVSQWDQQPQEAADIDWGNPSAGALVGLWHGGAAPIEVISGSPRSGGDNVSLVEYRATSEGQAQSTQVSSDNVGVKFTLVRPHPAASAFTIICRFQIKAVPGGDRDLVRFSNQSGENAQIILRSTGAIRGSTIRANTTVDSSATYTAGTWITAVYVGRSGDFRLWINGVRQAASGTSDLSPFQHRNEIHIRSSDASTVFAACFNAALSDDEVISLSANPWQLFARRDWIPFTASSGGGVTGTSSGTLALTGTAAGSIRVSGASAGTLALAGSSVGSVRVTGASSGTLALSGTSTGTVGAAGVTGASAGTLALTGTSTGTVQVTGASAGALGLTGSATGSVRVSGASAGTLSLTGTATGNTTGAVSGASVGVLSLSGSATGSVRVSGGSAAVLQITGTAGAQIIVRGVSAGVLSMSGSATGTTGGAEPEPTTALAKYTITARARKTAIQAKARRMEIKA